MITLMYDFINQCEVLGYTPDEKHIDAFLKKADAMHHRNSFIKFCFYSWENRMEVMEKLVNLQKN